MKKLKYLFAITVLLIITIVKVEAKTTINLSDLSNIKTYTQNDYNTFLNDYQNGNLPDVYVTEFLFDGAGMYKAYDLDDFIEEGNNITVKVLTSTVINIAKVGDYEFTGEITGGMIAVNTNNITGDINLILNGVKLDTDSKKIPAIYVYNKDITSTNCKVTVKTTNGTKNYLEGGKLKKVSLIGSDELSNYTNKYSGTNQTNYTAYTNYYGVYTKDEIANILFATVTADREDLADGDPVYFYKASGAISSDIDLYFEGAGYLEVTSKNKEGIETKGNLTFSGGTGDYVIYAEDDCLNTTTATSDNQNAHNSLSIDVNSLYAIVSNDADEGDAIDSNGTLTINGGTIIALAKSGSDAGLDSEKGTYINGGTVLATGDMLDPINGASKQNYMLLSFNGSVSADTTLTLLDSNDKVMFAFKTDRTFTNLIYSSSTLSNGAYYLYQDGEVSGTVNNGYYTTVNNYTKGIQLGYASTGLTNNGPGGMNRGDRGSTNASANYNEFTVSGISNSFSGIAKYTGTGNTTLVTSTTTYNFTSTGVLLGIIALLIVALIVLIIRRNKKKKIEE